MQLPDVFKTYDIRGLSPGEIDIDFARRLGQAFVEHTKAKAIVVGRDMRATTEGMSKALIEMLVSRGIQVIDVGLITTPMFYFAVASGGYDAGIMVTASHNPAQYNGFKMVEFDARPIAAERIQELKKIMESDFEISSGEGSITSINVYDDYLFKIFSLIKLSDLRRLNIVVDSGNGMAGVILPKLFEKISVEPTRLYWELDGRFPNHEANPIKDETLNDLKARVLREGADLGIAYDGDGDRVGFVDEKGETASTDLVGALLVPDILEHYPNGLILNDVRSTNVIGEEAKKLGGSSDFCQVGHALVKKMMRERGAVFAIELSGHVYFKDFYGVECPDLVTLMVMNKLAESDKKMSELIAPLRRYVHSGEINFEVNDKISVMRELGPELEKKYDGEGRTLKLDGIRVDFSDWWVSVRASNNPDPVVRLNLEAKTREMMEEKVREVTEIIKKY